MVGVRGCGLDDEGDKDKDEGKVNEKEEDKKKVNEKKKKRKEMEEQEGAEEELLHGASRERLLFRLFDLFPLPPKPACSSLKMALRSALTRSSKRSQNEMLDRFLSFQVSKSMQKPSSDPILESPSPNPSTSASTSTSTSTSSSTSDSLQSSPSSASSSKRVHPRQLRNKSNPFQPFLNPSTNRWWPAKISARREAQLIDLAFRTGTLDLVADESKKLNKLKSRLSDVKGTSSSILPNLSLKDEVWVLNHHPLIQSNPTPASAPSSSSSSAPVTVTEGGTKKAKEIMDREAKLEQYRVLRSLISKKGPYKGRKSIKMFKGTKDERNREARWIGINEKLNDMDGKVKEWRMTKADAKAKVQPALPF